MDSPHSTKKFKAIPLVTKNAALKFDYRQNLIRMFKVAPSYPCMFTKLIVPSSCDNEK